MITAAPENFEGGAASDRRGMMRMAAAAVLGGALALFAALNSQTVRVHWIVATTHVPMIVVIVGCGVVGAAIGWLACRRRRARSQNRGPTSNRRNVLSG